jgi:hypothetical protein
MRDTTDVGLIGCTLIAVHEIPGGRSFTLFVGLVRNPLGARDQGRRPSLSHSLIQGALHCAPQTPELRGLESFQQDPPRLALSAWREESIESTTIVRGERVD